MSCVIDYTDSDLSEAEIAFYLERDRRAVAKEREKERERVRKINTFRFSGGLC